MGLFGSRKNESAGANPMHVTHHLVLEGRCPKCKEIVTKTTTYTAVLGESGTAMGYAFCCGGEVDVSTRF